MATDTPALSAYQRRLLGFLSVATFFEGFDFLALAQILPNLRAAMDLSPRQGGVLLAVINCGMVLSYLLVRKADTWGRRRVLSVTIAGYTLASLASGLCPGPISFALCQLVARAFLMSEYAVAQVFAAEEFPAERRGMVIGVIQGASTLGAIVCAAVVPLLLRTPLGWRAVYFVGAAPLVIIAVARRTLRETSRFGALAGAVPAAAPLLRLLRTPYRRRVWPLAACWGLTYLCTQSAMVFWKEFARGERAFSDAQVGLSISIAAVASVPVVFLSGRLLDVLGRRAGAVLLFLMTSVGVAASYTLTSRAGLTVALAIGIAGSTAVLPVLNAFTAELFPTELRGDAFAWANSLLGRLGAVLSPLGVGLLAAEVGFGRAVGATALFPLLALLVILRYLPETRGQELEQSARL